MHNREYREGLQS